MKKRKKINNKASRLKSIQKKLVDHEKAIEKLYEEMDKINGMKMMVLSKNW